MIQLLLENSIRKYVIISEENISQEFKMKNIDKTRNYLVKEINQNEVISKKHKNVYRVLNNTEHLTLYWLPNIILIFKF